MKKFFALALALIMLTMTAVPAMAYDDSNYPIEIENMEYYEKFKGQGIELSVCNWGEYLANDPISFIDVNKIFEEITGIKINYSLFSSNEELYAKMQAGGARYDIIVPSDYMIGRMIGEGMLEKLNFENIPNYKYIDEKYKNANFDPENEYSVPIYWGAVGIVYNSEMVDPEEIKGWDILWDEKYKDNMLMFSNPRDAFAIALLDLGYSFNTTNPDELREAAEHLKEQKPLVQAYVMDEIYDKMEGEEAAIAPYYNGDVILMREENENLGFFMPEETSIFIDSFCIPATCENKEAAELYINFMCETDIAAANSIYVGYSTPHSEALKQLDEELQNDETAYPDVEGFDAFLTLPAETNELIDTLWTEIIAIDSESSSLFFIILVAGLLAGAVAIVLIRRVKSRRNTY